VLLVNDCSPDERIVPLLRSYVRDHVELIDSPVNEGFSASVNKGMQYSDRDVILLNSDTIVTHGWVEQLIACAYHDRETGTVTPLSNSATLCSVPIMCQDNAIPDHFTIDEYAALIHRCSLREYPRITVAVGFCMYIKREVLDITGYFDAATFGRGYGEENDFCNRAEQYGYKHVMCDDTFIYHKGTASFDTEMKRALCSEHDAILQVRYPRQMRRNSEYCAANPEQYIRDNIHVYSQLHNGKQNLLYLCMADFREDSDNHIGGTQYHLRDLALGMKEDYNVFVAARDQDYLRLTIYCGQERTSFRFWIGSTSSYPMYFNARLRELYLQILNAFQISMVHVHHILGLSLDIFYCAHELGIPVIFTAHDYYMCCPTIKLMDGDNCFCCAPGEVRDAKRCCNCLKKQQEISLQVQFIDQWQAQNRRALALCEKILVPSESVRTYFCQFYPELEHLLQVIPHGTEDITSDVQVIAPTKIEPNKDILLCVDYAFDRLLSPNEVAGWAYLPYVDNKKVNVVVSVTDSSGATRYVKASKLKRTDVTTTVGDPLADHCGFSAEIFRWQLEPGELKVRILLEYDGVYYWNGGEDVRENPIPKADRKSKLRVAFLGAMTPEKGSGMAYQLITQSSKDIHWYIFGATSDSHIADLKLSNLTTVGSYQRDNLLELMQMYAIDLVCILPIWPETFCYTLSEAWMCGLPVLVTDIGAVGDRTRAQGGGIVVPVDASAQEVLAQIEALSQNPDQLAQLRQQVSKLHVKTIDEMVEDYRTFYRGIPQTTPNYGEADAKLIFSGLQGTTSRFHQGNQSLDQVLERQKALDKLNTELTLENQELKRERGYFIYRVARKLRKLQLAVLRAFGRKV
jgi:glycosyltransferase involved in cell wall biosynthesis